MKRHLLTAALAIVALGGAVASTANSSRLDIPVGPLNSTPTSNPACGANTANCSTTDNFPCTISSVRQYGPDDLGNCTIELFQPNP